MKTTPDHLILLDRLVNAHGIPAEVDLWEDVKADLKNAAHQAKPK